MQREEVTPLALDADHHADAVQVVLDHAIALALGEPAYSGLREEINRLS